VLQDGLQQRAFPPVAQPEALKGSATSSMGSSPCGSLKMQVHSHHNFTFTALNLLTLVADCD
jgi:hypothetical protein